MATTAPRSRISAQLHVRSNLTGEMVPLGTLIDVENVLGPTLLNRYNMFRSATVTAVPAAGPVDRRRDPGAGGDRGRNAAAGLCL